jgi:hypothetical protein
MVTRLIQLAGRQFQPGRVDAPAVAEIEKAPGFVEREEILDAIAQPLGDLAGIFGERL